MCQIKTCMYFLFSQTRGKFCSKCLHGAEKSVCYNKCLLLKCPLYRGFSIRVWPLFGRFLKKVYTITNKNEVFIIVTHTVFSELCWIDLSSYSGWALLRLLTDGRVGEAKRFFPLLKICYTYSTVMKRNTVVT